MTAPADLETRLRAGLRAAGDALPHADLTDPSRAADPTGPDHRAADGSALLRRRSAGLAAAVAAMVAVASVAAVAVTRDSGEDGGADVATEPTLPPSTTDTTTPTTAGPAGVLGDDPGPRVEPVAGSAVITDGQLVTYGPDGEPGATVPLAPLTRVDAAAPDLHGGWIVCGTPPAATASTPLPGGASPTSTVVGPDATTLEQRADELEAEIRARLDDVAEEASAQPGTAPAPPQPNAYRFRAGQEPVPLGVNVHCLDDSLSVTEVDGHTVLFYVSPATFSGRQLDLVTGADAALQIDVGDAGLSDVAVGGGRLAVLGDAGLGLWDLATGEPIAAGPVDLPSRPAAATSGPFTDDMELSPDGATLAALVSDGSAPSDLVVIDLASGGELFRRLDAAPVEGSQLTFDGTSVAVGSFYEGQATVFDVATGSERTIDAHGVIP
jgi:hypothetical protein